MAQISCKNAQELMLALKKGFPALKQSLEEFNSTGSLSSQNTTQTWMKICKGHAETLHEHLPIGYRFDLARELMNDGFNFYGPEEVKDAFLDGSPFPEDETESIPFSRAELLDAAKKGEHLIYRYKLGFGSLGELFNRLSPWRRDMLQGINDDANRIQDLQNIKGNIEKSGWALVSLGLESSKGVDLTGQNISVISRLQEIREINQSNEWFNSHVNGLYSKISLAEKWIKDFNRSPADYDADSVNSHIVDALSDLLPYKHSVAEYVYDLAVTGWHPKRVDGVVTRDKTDIGFIQIKHSPNDIDDMGKWKYDLDEFRFFETDDLSGTGTTFQRFE